MYNTKHTHTHTPNSPSETLRKQKDRSHLSEAKWVAGIRVAEMANKERAASSSASHLNICPKTGVSINGDAMGCLT